MKGHTLDILCSLQELLNLFNIDTYDITFQILAKKKVLMTHQINRDYRANILFYKKAFEVVLNFITTKPNKMQKCEIKITAH